MNQEEKRREREIRWGKLLDSVAPPGIGTDGEIRGYITGLVISLFLSFDFFENYNNAYSELYRSVEEMIPGAKMMDFAEVLGTSLHWFWLYSVFVIFMVVRYYLYYRQGSKSIYLMKRLPSRLEIHKRAWTLPLLGVIVTLLAALAVLVLYFEIYMIVTPKECITAGQWQKIWR